MSKVKKFNLTPRDLMRHLAARNSLQFLDCHQLDKGATDDYYMYASDKRKDRVFVWHVAFDFDGELLVATELFVFDPDNAPEQVPGPVLLEALKLKKRGDMDRYREGELQWQR